eukprot:scaffold34515_cov61-Phaeocystis_antarctica.AAC.4
MYPTTCVPTSQRALTSSLSSAHAGVETAARPSVQGHCAHLSLSLSRSLARSQARAQLSHHCHRHRHPATSALTAFLWQRPPMACTIPRVYSPRLAPQAAAGTTIGQAAGVR